jgi:hypothetical protein
MDSGIVYYTNNRLDPGVMGAAQRQILKAGLPIVSVSLSPLDFGENHVVMAEPGYLTMFRQILTGLEASTAEVIFFCEHDILYHLSHFDFIPGRQDIYYYNENVYKVRYPDGKAVTFLCKQTSGLCAHRELLLKHYRERVRRVELEGYTREMGFEPGTHNRAARVDDCKAERWMSDYPNIDIRHNANLTPSRWRKDQFRNQQFTEGWQEATSVPGWGEVANGKIVEVIKCLNSVS